jgi:hypothetical protein
MMQLNHGRKNLGKHGEVPMELSTYEFRYIVPHLVAANRYGQLDRLLRLETEERVNAWFEMRQRAKMRATTTN